MLEHLGELHEGAKLLEEIVTPEERRLLGFTPDTTRVDRIRAGAERAILEDAEIGSIEHVPHVRMQDRRDLRPVQGKQADGELVFAFADPLDAQDLYDFVIETGLVVPGEVALVMDDQAHQYSVHFTPLVLVAKPDVIQMALAAYADRLEPEDEDAWESLAEDVGAVLAERAARKPSPRGSAEPSSTGRGVDFNPFHNPQGKFTSRAGLGDGGSWSDGQKVRLKATKRGAKLHFAGTKRPCGREARGQGKDIRCWDGKPGLGLPLAKMQGAFAQMKRRGTPMPLPGRKKHEDWFRPEDWRLIWECQALYGMQPQDRYPQDDQEALTLAQHQGAADAALAEGSGRGRAARAGEAAPAAGTMGALRAAGERRATEGTAQGMGALLDALEEGFGRRSGRGRDPYWITAKYAGKDANGTSFKKGERVFYYPNDRSILAGPAAEQAAREFQAAVDDERFMTGGY